jgi:hypothetical protein
MPLLYDAALEPYFSKKIPDTEVHQPPIAQDVCIFVSIELTIEPPEIVWICSAPPTSKNGLLQQYPEEESDAIVRLKQDTVISRGLSPLC